jgi:hypothetical protein
LAAGTHNPQSGDSFARLGAPAGASISADIAAISVGSGGLDAAGVRAAIGLASANLDTQLGDLPTNSELATALAGSDDATLSAIAAALAGYVDTLETELAKVIKTGQQFTATDGTGSKNVTFTRV